MPDTLVTITKGAFRGQWATVLIEQQAEYNKQPTTFGYQIELPSGWIVNVPADYVERHQ